MVAPFATAPTGGPVLLFGEVGLTGLFISPPAPFPAVPTIETWIGIAALALAGGGLGAGYVTHRALRRFERQTIVAFADVAETLKQVRGSLTEVTDIARAQRDRLDALEGQVKDIQDFIHRVPAATGTIALEAAQRAEAAAWNRLNPIAKAAQQAGEVLGTAVAAGVEGFRKGLRGLFRRR